MLSNFQVGERALLQCFLLGQDEFRQTLALENMEQLRQRIIVAYHLNPLEKDETRGYIEHRLKLVGWETDPVITDEAYEVIYEHTEGLPRRINALCDRVLLCTYVEESHIVDQQAVSSVIKEMNLEGFHSERTVKAAIEADQSFEERLIRLEEAVAVLEEVASRFSNKIQPDSVPAAGLYRVSTCSKD
jgi:Holliday junction resolvasome RuvABC ATP-dependent DNA helicase subunit